MKISGETLNGVREKREEIQVEWPHKLIGYLKCIFPWVCFRKQSFEKGNFSISISLHVLLPQQRDPSRKFGPRQF